MSKCGKKTIIIGIFFVTVCHLLLSGLAHGNTAINRFFFRLTHPNPIVWNGLSIRYEDTIRYSARDDSQGLQFHYWGLKPEGSLHFDTTEFTSAEDFEHHIKSKKYRKITKLELTDSSKERILECVFQNTKTGDTFHIFVMLDRSLVCGYMGPKDNYSFFESTLISAVFGN